MSRAFVKDAEDKADDLPDRPISPHRNLVTKEGLAAIEVALGRFEAAHRAAIDKSDTPSTDKSRASFSMTVTLRRADGRKQTFRIVGEDEAGPPRDDLVAVALMIASQSDRSAHRMAERMSARSVQHRRSILSDAPFATCRGL
jgi:transcription elongation GreA/GreB family factor